ncbi:MAG: GNAT family N-acetyltransferase [Thermoplasmata archaeon]
MESARDLSDELRLYLSLDPIGNAFALHDLSREPDRTELWIARVEGQLRAHLLVYDPHEFGVKWVHLSGRPDAAEELLAHLPARKAVAITDPALAPQIASRFETSGLYPEDIMVAEMGSARLIASSLAVRLTGEHAEEYARLVVPSVFPLNEKVLELNRRRLNDEVVYGIFADGVLVSVAGTSVRTPGAWIVGGIQTLPSHRKKGYATQVTSAVTKEALGEAGRAGLYVRRDNDAAIRVYERLGYRKVGERVWIDLGTGLAP